MWKLSTRLSALLLVLLLFSSGLSFGEAIRPVGEMSETELLEELMTTLEKLKMENETLTMLNIKLKTQQEILVVSLGQMTTLYDTQGALLAKAWNLFGSDKDATERKEEEDSRTLWYWRIVAAIASGAALYFAAR